MVNFLLNWLISVFSFCVWWIIETELTENVHKFSMKVLIDKSKN